LTCRFHPRKIRHEIIGQTIALPDHRELGSGVSVVDVVDKEKAERTVSKSQFHI